jgi:malonyl-CoA decarboxylase
VALLQLELKNIRAFATLSPIPGFGRWLTAHLADGDPALIEEEAASVLRQLAPANLALPAPASPGASAGLILVETPVQTLARVLARRGWQREEALAKVLEPVLLRACARYLLNEGAKANPRRARDPVAHFHLSNGARVERLNWRADVSEKGLKESCGLMVNYLYDPAKIEEHHEAYVGEGRRPAGAVLRKLARVG